MIDLRQARQRYAAREPFALDEELSDDLAIPSPEAAALDRIMLSRALRQLAPKHLAALDLVCGQGFAIDEAARILGVPSGTVKSRLSYARRALLDALRKGAIS